MDKEFTRRFTKCPCCGSEDRFCEQLGNELKERGLAREEWNFRLDVKEGVVVDKAKADAIPIGSEVPSYGIMTDVCMDCGCMYAIDLTRMDVKKPPPPPSVLLPNRAERRRMDRGDSPQPSDFGRN